MTRVELGDALGKKGVWAKGKQTLRPYVRKPMACSRQAMQADLAGTWGQGQSGLS